MQSLSLKANSLTLRRAPLATAMMAVLCAAPAIAADDEKPGVSAPPGLPGGVDWKFNLDASWGSFGFGNSLYRDPKPGEPSGDLSDNWFEASVKPAISGAYTLGNSSQVYGKLSAVGERTYSAPPPLVGGEASSFDVDDMFIGWRSGESIPGLDENALDLKVGRAQYNLGHGLLLWDGSAEGGSRGGYWTNARKAFAFAAIAKFKSGNDLVEVFHLKKDELPEARTGTKVTGLNYERSIGEDTTLGGAYLKLSANEDEAPQRDGLSVYNLRAFTAPFAKLKALSFELEYAKEDNGDALDSYAWNALAAYQFDTKWQPKLSYRYAFFQGDDPATSKNEGFDGLLTGFYDWGTWWQGEIAGEYFLSNSNLISHQLRVHTKPTETIGTGLIFYNFKLDKPAALGPGVTSDKVADELDWYMDWAINNNFTLSFVAAAAKPHEAIEQVSGRTSTFYYGMIYAAYSF